MEQSSSENVSSAADSSENCLLHGPVINDESALLFSNSLTDFTFFHFAVFSGTMFQHLQNNTDLCPQQQNMHFVDYNVIRTERTNVSCQLTSSIYTHSVYVCYLHSD